MSSLSRNATHSLGCGRRLAADRTRRQGLALLVHAAHGAALAGTSCGALRGAASASTRSRAAAGLLQVDRQDAVERRDALDDRLDAGAATQPPVA